MPFLLIPTTLGICFVLLWVFIGGMILRDSQLAARSDRDLDIPILPLSTRGPVFRPRDRHGPKGQPAMRVAS
jgi:hypothetical protein